MVVLSTMLILHRTIVSKLKQKGSVRHMCQRFNTHNDTRTMLRNSPRDLFIMILVFFSSTLSLSNTRRRAATVVSLYPRQMSAWNADLVVLTSSEKRPAVVEGRRVGIGGRAGG